MVKTVKLQPSRIGCPSIPGTMKGMIASLKGVEAVKIYYDERALEVTFDDALTSEAEIIKKIGAEMGLALRVKPTSPDQNAPGIAQTCPM